MSALSDTSHLIPNEPFKMSVGKGNIFWVNPKISPTLNIPTESAAKLFCGLKTSQEVAHLLEIPHGQLHYHLYPVQRGYKSFNIKKKTGGYRKIDSPGKSIKILQNKIKPLIEHYYKVKKPVHGFVLGKSIISNAEQHKKKEICFKFRFN